MIGGMPAARSSDMALCVGPVDTIAMGSATVMIGGLPAARMGDMCAHGGTIVMGCPTVLIGDSGSGGGGVGTSAFRSIAASVQAITMSSARAEAQPFVQAQCDAMAAEARTAQSPLRTAPDPTKTAWIEVRMVDEQGGPVASQRVRLTAPDGAVREGFTNADGLLRIDGIDPGECEVSFPDLDRDAYSPA